MVGCSPTIRGKVACNGTSEAQQSAICRSYTYTHGTRGCPPPLKKKVLFFGILHATCGRKGSFILNIFQKAILRWTTWKGVEGFRRTQVKIHNSPERVLRDSGCTDHAVGVSKYKHHEVVDLPWTVNPRSKVKLRSLVQWKRLQKFCISIHQKFSLKRRLNQILHN